MLVGLALLVETLPFGALSPLLPELKDELELSAGQAGVLVAMLPCGFILAALPSARCSTRFGERATVATGLGVLAATSVAFGLADSFPTLLGSRLLQGVGAGAVFSGGLTWLIHAVPAERRGAILGVGTSAVAAGNLAGPALGALAAVAGRATVFGSVAAAVALLSVAATQLPRHPAALQRPPLRLACALRDRGMRAAVWLTAIPSGIAGALLVLVPLRLDRLGLDASGVALAFVLAASVGVLCRPLVGRWSDRRGRLLPIRLGLVVAVPLTLALALVSSGWVAALLAAATLAVIGLCAAPAIALLSDHLEARQLGQASGIAVNILTWTTAAIAGSIAAGALDGAAGSTVAFGACAASAVAALGVGRVRM